MAKNRILDQVSHALLQKKLSGIVSITRSGVLHCYKRKCDVTFPLIAKNKFNEPVLVAFYGKNQTAIFESYPSLRYYLDVSSQNLEIYDYKKGSWRQIDFSLNVISGNGGVVSDKKDHFWLLAAVIGALAAVTAIIAVL